MGDNWARCIALLLTVSIAGCGTLRDLPSCQKLAERNKSENSSQVRPGVTVSLATGQFKPPRTIDEVRDPAGEAAVGGIALVTDTCFRAVVTLGPFVFLCAPIGAMVGVISHGVSSTENTAQVNAPENQEKTLKMTSAEAIEKNVSNVVEIINLNRLLLEQVKQYARDSGVGDLPELSGQGPTSLGDEPQYRGGRDFVLEIVLTGSVVENTDASSYLLRFFVQGRLIRMADNSVARVFTTTEATDTKPKDEWKADNGRLAAIEVNKTLQRIAKRSVDQWIRPTIGGTPHARAVAVLLRPNRISGGLRSVDISIDGCIVGSLANNSSLTINTSAGKHTIRSEGFASLGFVAAAASLDVELAPGKTHYFILHPSPGKSSWVLSEIDENVVIMNFPDLQKPVR